MHNLKQNIKNQSKALMGADFIIDSRQLPSEKVQAIIDSLNVAASEVNFVSMAAFPKNDGTKLVKVRAIEGNFPFYGTLDTEPENAASTYQELGGALVDATLMLQYNIKPGDSIKLGKLTFSIIGALKSIPGSTGFSTSVAPTVLIPFRFIDETEKIELEVNDSDLSSLHNLLKSDKKITLLKKHNMTIFQILMQEFMEAKYEKINNCNIFKNLTLGIDPKLFTHNQIKKNFTISGNGKQVRDVLHSEDVTSLYFSAINKQR